MIKLYTKDKVLIGNLSECSRAIAIEERNGMCEIEIDYQLFSPHYDKLVRGNIIETDLNDKITKQLFRIYKVTKDIMGHFTVYAKHISFDLGRDYIESIDIENQSCVYCLNSLFRDSQFSQAFKGHSDIVNAQNYKINNVNLLKAIVGEKGSILDTFGTGAEIKRDNYDFYVLNKRGHDNGVVIEYASNLTGLNYEEDEEGLITRIRAIAKYTPKDEEGNNSEEVIIHTYVDSEKINNYETPFISEIDFSDKFEEDEIPTVEKLTTLANKYFEENKCDIMKFNYEISFIPLSKCVGYEDIQDQIELCDTVTIIDYRYNLNTKAKVIKTTYDILKQRYESMELGEPRTSLGDIFTSEDSKGEKGDKGDKGDKGEDGSIGDFPNSLPSTPTLSAKVLGFASIELSWTYENKVYYNYEIYASKTQGFTPNSFDLIHAGQTSSFLFQAKPNETWYFRACAINTHGQRTKFSDEVEVITTKVDDLENYFSSAAIGNAVVGSLISDYMEAGIIKGEWIDAKNLSVTDGNGKRTLDIDSFGNVNLDVTSLKIAGGSVLDTMSQTQIFNKLTAGETEQGIYLQNGKVYINGEYLKANSIKASSINVGDYTNFVILEPNATFTGKSNGTTQGYEVCNIYGSEKYNHYIITNNLYDFEAGDKFRVRGSYKCNTTNSMLQFTTCWRDSNGNLLSSATTNCTITQANTWQDIDTIMTIPTRPTNASYMNIKFNVADNQSRRFYIEGLSITKMISGELIVDGAIDGKLITGATIVGGRIRGSSNFYTSPNDEATDGYNFRIYSDGRLYSGSLINTSSGTSYSLMQPDGIISCSNYVHSNKGMVTGQGSLWLGIRGIELGSNSNFNIELTQQADKNVYFRPGYNGQAILGHPAYMWNTVYSVNGTSSSSDRTMKENIKYLNTRNNTKAIQSNLTEKELYSFVKDDLIMAEYNFIGDNKKHIGFIAQDLLYNIDGTDNKIGQLLVNPPTEEQPSLSYNEKIYTNILAGALRYAINKIEQLEEEIKELKK